MDTALENGDFKTNQRGYPIQIDGYDEILQRILLRLCCKKGSFIYDTSLGSNLYKLKVSQIANASVEKYALDYANEALKDMPFVHINAVNSYSENDGDRINICYKINIDGQTSDINVSV